MTHPAQSAVCIIIEWLGLVQSVVNSQVLLANERPRKIARVEPPWSSYTERPMCGCTDEALCAARAETCGEFDGQQSPAADSDNDDLSSGDDQMREILAQAGIISGSDSDSSSDPDADAVQRHDTGNVKSLGAGGLLGGGRARGAKADDRFERLIAYCE